MYESYIRVRYILFLKNAGNYLKKNYYAYLFVCIDDVCHNVH